MIKIMAGVEMYDSVELSKLLGISIVTVRIYMKEGRIPARKIGTKWFVSEKNLQEFLNSTSNQSYDE